MKVSIPPIAYDVLQWRFEEVRRTFFPRWNTNGDWQAAFLGETDWPYKPRAHKTDFDKQRILVDVEFITFYGEEMGLSESQWAGVTREHFSDDLLVELDAALIHNICHATTSPSHKKKWRDRMHSAKLKAKWIKQRNLAERIERRIGSRFWPIIKDDVKPYLAAKYNVDWEWFEENTLEHVRLNAAQSRRDANTVYAERRLSTLRQKAEKAEKACKAVKADDSPQAKDLLSRFLKARIAADKLHCAILQGKPINASGQQVKWEALELYRMLYNQHPEIELCDLALFGHAFGFVHIGGKHLKDRSHCRNHAEEFLRRNEKHAPGLLNAIQKSLPT